MKKLIIVGLLLLLTSPLVKAQFSEHMLWGKEGDILSVRWTDNSPVTFELEPIYPFNNWQEIIFVSPTNLSSSGIVDINIAYLSRQERSSIVADNYRFRLKAIENGVFKDYALLYVSIGSYKEEENKDKIEVLDNKIENLKKKIEALENRPSLEEVWAELNGLNNKRLEQENKIAQIMNGLEDLDVNIRTFLTTKLKDVEDRVGSLNTYMNVLAVLFIVFIISIIYTRRLKLEKKQEPSKVTDEDIKKAIDELAKKLRGGEESG